MTFLHLHVSSIFFCLIPEAGMVDQLNKITALKITEQKEEKQEGLRPVIISLKTDHVLHGEG